MRKLFRLNTLNIFGKFCHFLSSVSSFFSSLYNKSNRVKTASTDILTNEQTTNNMLREQILELTGLPKELAKLIDEYVVVSTSHVLYSSELEASIVIDINSAQDKHKLLRLCLDYSKQRLEFESNLNNNSDNHDFHGSITSERKTIEDEFSEYNDMQSLKKTAIRYCTLYYSAKDKFKRERNYTVHESANTGENYFYRFSDENYGYHQIQNYTP